MIKQLSEEYLALWNDYRRHYHRLLPQTVFFMEDKPTSEDLSTHINMDDVLQSSNDSDEFIETTTKDISIDHLKIQTRLTFAREILDQYQSNTRRSSSDNQHFLSQFKVYVHVNILLIICLSGM